MRTCIHCGCTDDNACTEILAGVMHTCRWVTMSDDGETGECSACVDDEGVVDPNYETLTDVGDDDLLVPSRELILPGDPEFHL